MLLVPSRCTICVRQVPFSDWELRPEDVVICKRANGEDWQIGNGAFGQVYKATLNGVQTVAVKVVRGQDPREQVCSLGGCCAFVQRYKSGQGLGCVQLCRGCVSVYQLLSTLSPSNQRNPLLDIARCLNCAHDPQCAHFVKAGPRTECRYMHLQ